MSLVVHVLTHHEDGLIFGEDIYTCDRFSFNAAQLDQRPFLRLERGGFMREIEFHTDGYYWDITVTCGPDVVAAYTRVRAKTLRELAA